MKMKQLSLYIHIPFCVRKCNYCDFLSAPADETTREVYMQALLSEIEELKGSPVAERDVKTIFIGGGTPSLMTEAQTEKLLDKIKDVFLLTPDCEISIEVNPGTVTREKSECYFKNGIHRISIGLQSPDNALLKTLGRIHTYEEFLKTYAYVRAAGIQNVNIDLMSALPGQTAEQYCNGLKAVAELGAEHISAYSLILEEGTPFFEKYNSARDLMPDEEEERDMYEKTGDILKQYGYERYEISNYAKKGYECRHNTVYWRCEDYLGLGLGSASLVDGVRFKNTCDLKEYMHAWKSGEGKSVQRREEEVLTENARMEEFMFLGLRMMKGVSEERFLAECGKSMQAVYGDRIKKLLGEKLVCYRDGDKNRRYLALTPFGIDVSNYVFEQFLF